MRTQIRCTEDISKWIQEDNLAESNVLFSTSRLQMYTQKNFCWLEIKAGPLIILIWYREDTVSIMKMFFSQFFVFCFCHFWLSTQLIITHSSSFFQAPTPQIILSVGWNAVELHWPIILQSSSPPHYFTFSTQWAKTWFLCISRESYRIHI